MKNPAYAGRKQGFISGMVSDAVSSSDATLRPYEDQAIRWLLRRVSVAPATARAIVELQGIGGHAQ